MYSQNRWWCSIARRCLKHCLLHAWVQFVPLSKEEKIKELCRAEMRRKVAAWLPDYQPRNFGQEQDSEPDWVMIIVLHSLLLSNYHCSYSILSVFHIHDVICMVTHTLSSMWYGIVVPPTTTVEFSGGYNNFFFFHYQRCSQQSNCNAKHPPAQHYTCMYSSMMLYYVYWQWLHIHILQVACGMPKPTQVSEALLYCPLPQWSSMGGEI